MIRQGLTRSGLLEILRGMHQEGDAYALALIRGDHKGDFDERTQSYAQLGPDEAEGDGYTAGGIVLQDYFATFVADEASIGWSPVVWPVATLSAVGGLLYNASKDGRVLQVIAFERGVVSSTDGPFSVELKRAGQIRIRLGTDG